MELGKVAEPTKEAREAVKNWFNSPEYDQTIKKYPTDHYLALAFDRFAAAAAEQARAEAIRECAQLADKFAAEHSAYVAPGKTIKGDLGELTIWMRAAVRTVANDIRALAASPAQQRSDRASLWLQWATETFGQIALQPMERGLRFVEEAVEAGHALGISGEAMAAILRRVYEREPGELARELGQCLGTLELLARVSRIDLEAEAAAEWDRVRTIPKDEWAERHAAKVAVGIALPATTKAADG